MYTNILVPLDGSPQAEAALPYATALAERSGGRLTLIRAARAHIVHDRPSDQTRAINEAEAYLVGVTESLAAKAVNVQVGVPYGDSPAAWIVEEVGLRGAELIVMATHARVGADHVLHGSVAEAVVARAGVPVLVTRPDVSVTAKRLEDAQPTVVLALDSSELAEAAIPAATQLVRLLHGRLVLVGVVPKAGDLVAGPGMIVTYVGDEYARWLDEARQYLDRIAERIAANGLTAETVVRTGDAAAEVVAVANDYEAALIVMATHGRTGLARAFLGSVAGQVVARGPVPVLLIRPPSLRHAEQPALARSHTPAGASPRPMGAQP